jgi:hypothetical protein
MKQNFAPIHWLSTFTVLGGILLILGVIGLIVGPKFVFDPGQIPDGKEAWYYILVGALMVLNGVSSPALTHEEKLEAARKAANPGVPKNRAFEARPVAVVRPENSGSDQA